MSEHHRDESTLEGTLWQALTHAEPPRLRTALLDAVFGGGGRIRPKLCLAVAGAGVRPPTARTYAAAAAVELVHCASLVHDDLPCFDDAMTRRGRPSIHRKHGQATAVLVGDALIVAAFETLARARGPSSDIVVLARAAGAHGGLVSGQGLELEDAAVDVAAYHAAKTASLFETAVQLGASSTDLDATRFAGLGRAFGLFYQLADDVADVHGSEAVLGKPTGRDAARGRPNAAVRRGEPGAVLRRAANGVLDAVPDCPGYELLRGFVRDALEALVTRSAPAATLPERESSVSHRG